jgi:hypothetical protein
MLPRIYCCWVAAVFWANAITYSQAFAQHSSFCFEFQPYDGETGTVGIKNICSGCMQAVVHWCGGSALPIKLAASAAGRVQGIPGCMMRITGGARCAEASSLHPAKLSRKYVLQAKKGNEPAVTPPPPERQPFPSGEDRTAPHPPAHEKDLASVNDAGALAATNPIEAAKEPSRSLFAAETGWRTPTQMEVFAGASEDDWRALSCSESGQSLIKQADALLSRRAALQTMLIELRLRSDAIDNLEEAIAAVKEVQAIDREVGKFRERAKAIIDKSASN